MCVCVRERRKKIDRKMNLDRSIDRIDIDIDSKRRRIICFNKFEREERFGRYWLPIMFPRKTLLNVPHLGFRKLYSTPGGKWTKKNLQLNYTSNRESEPS